MDFSLPKELAPKLDAMRAIVLEHIMPIETEMLATKSFYAIQPKINAVRVKVKEAGLWAPQIPKAEGGMGLTLMEHARVSEVLGRSPLGHFAFNCQAPDAGNMEILIQFGKPEQKEKFLKPLLNGDIRSCFAMTEPDRAGSNPTWLDTRARKDGNEYVIDGTK
jgi:acyl-CoA dehydrogenase